METYFLNYKIFYLFKSSKFSIDDSNLGNPFFNFILKNLVLYLDKNKSKKIQFESNLYELLKDLYISDVNYLIIEKKFIRKIIWNIHLLISIIFFPKMTE